MACKKYSAGVPKVKLKGLSVKKSKSKRGRK